jgi:hypothetical protein
MAAPTIYKAASASELEFGITNETGIILTSFSRNVTAQKSEVRDADNEVVAVAYTGLTAAITLAGFINGDLTMNVAALLTLTNDIDSYGLSGGTVIVDSINESSTQGEFRQVSVSATQYAETLTAD